MADTTRSPAPPLTLSSPPCPICDNETCNAFVDDPGEFTCETCAAYWDERTGAFSGWYDPTAEQCQSTTYNTWRKVTHHCLLASGHAARHNDGDYPPWSDSTAVHTPVDG